MSSTAFAVKERGGRPFAESAWGEGEGESELTAEIEESITAMAFPIVVDGDKLEINSALLDINRVYPFEYLGSQMVLWKLPSGAIDLFEIMEE